MAADKPAEKFSLPGLGQMAASAPFVAAPQGSNRLTIAQNLTRLWCLDVLVHVMSSSELACSPFLLLLSLDRADPAILCLTNFCQMALAAFEKKLSDFSVA